MKFLKMLTLCCCSISGMAAFGADNQAPCPRGFQPFAERCISQRMADYITCVEHSGGNQAKISSEVSNANSGQFSAAAKGSGSGVVAKGSGSLVIDKNGEQALAQKFEATWGPTAMQECRMVLNGPGTPKPKSEAPKRDKPSDGSGPTHDGAQAKSPKTVDSTVDLPPAGSPEQLTSEPYQPFKPRAEAKERVLIVHIPPGAKIVSIKAFAREKGAPDWRSCYQGDDGFDCDLGWSRFKGRYETSSDGQTISWPVQNWSANREREARLEVAYLP